MTVKILDARSGRAMGAGRTLAPLLIAAGAGAAATAAPVVSVLALAALAAYALMRGASVHVNTASLAGPAFAALIVGAFVGMDGAIGVVFAWRLIADAAWSVGEAARLAHAEGRPAQATRRALAHAWLTPLYGLTLVAYTAPHMIAGLPLDLPHVPAWLPLLAGGAAAVSVFDWALRRAADWRLGELAAAQSTHLLAHHVVFLLAFGLTLDVSAGVIALMAWRLAYAAPQPNFTAVP